MRYSANIDYFLLLGNFTKDVFSAERAVRVAKSGFVNEETIISNCCETYGLSGDRGKLNFVKWVWDRQKQTDIREWTFFEKLYSDNAKDRVYYGLIAEQLNKMWRNW